MAAAACQKKGRPCGTPPSFVSVAFRSRSEVELDRGLNDAVTLFLSYVPNNGVLTLPVFGSKPRVRLVPLNDHSGWFRKLVPLNRSCSFLDSLNWKFLKSPRSELKKAGP